MTTEKTTLLAGVAGFIGVHLAEALLKRGERVIGVDNVLTGSRENIERLKRNPNFVFLEHDIAEPLNLPGEELQFIYNLACPASPTDLGRLQMQIL